LFTFSYVDRYALYMTLCFLLEQWTCVASVQNCHACFFVITTEVNFIKVIVNRAVLW